MKINLILVLVVLAQTIFAQNKLSYLHQNRINLRTQPPNLSERDFNIIGFGALHGSAKTYEAELALVTNLFENNHLDYYIIETNYSQAFYVQEYLRTGDEDLLKELVFAFQTLVSQEGSIETFDYWKKVRALQQRFPQRRIKVLGCDVVHEYRFPIKHILSITNDDESWEQREVLKQIIANKETSFAIWNEELNTQV